MNFLIYKKKTSSYISPIILKGNEKIFSYYTQNLFLVLFVIFWNFCVNEENKFIRYKTIKLSELLIGDAVQELLRQNNILKIPAISLIPSYN